VWSKYLFFWSRLEEEAANRLHVYTSDRQGVGGRDGDVMKRQWFLVVRGGAGKGKGPPL